MYGLPPLPNRVIILMVDKLVELLRGIPLGEPQKDTRDEEVDVMVHPGVGNLVVLDHPNTPHKGSRQRILMLKAW